MSLRDRPGPGVQGFPVLFIATAESNLCPTDTPQSLDRDHFGSPVAPRRYLGRTGGRRPGSRAGGWGATPGLGTLLPRRTPRFRFLGDNSINCCCHGEGWGFPASD